MTAEDDDFDELEDDERDDDGRGWAWPADGYPPPPPGLGRRPVVLIVTAVVAAAAGFGVVAAAMHDVAGSPAAAAATPSGSSGIGSLGTDSPGGGQSLLPPQSGSGSGGSIPTPGPGQRLQLQIGGRVTAVSAASITIGAGSQSVTAAVTKSTRVTGKVVSIAGVKVGDMVSATITGTNGKLAADTIQDPASLP